MIIKYKMSGYTCLTPCPYNFIDGVKVYSHACKNCGWFGAKRKKENIIICDHPAPKEKRKIEKKKNFVWIAEASINGGEWKALTGDSAGSKKECIIMIQEMKNGCGYGNVKLRPVKYETTKI